MFTRNVIIRACKSLTGKLWFITRWEWGYKVSNRGLVGGVLMSEKYGPIV